MLNTTLKSMLLGFSGALVVVGTLFATLPKVEEAHSASPEPPNEIVERTLNGIPELELEHYKLTDDTYFDYILEGNLSIGRSNPAELNTWYKKTLKNPSHVMKNDDIREKISVALANGSSSALLNTLSDSVQQSKTPDTETPDTETPQQLPALPGENTSTDTPTNGATSDQSTGNITDLPANTDNTTGTGSLLPTLTDKGISKMDKHQNEFMDRVNSNKKATVSATMATAKISATEKAEIEALVSDHMNKFNAVYVYSEFLQKYVNMMDSVVASSNTGEFAGFKGDNALYALALIYQDTYNALTLDTAYDTKLLSNIRDLTTISDTLRKDYNNQLLSKDNTVDVTKKLYITSQDTLIEQLKGLE